ELIGDAAQQRIVLPTLDLCQEARPAQIGSEIAKELDLADPARHDRLGHSSAVKRGDNLAQLPDVNPRDLIGDFLDRLVAFTSVGYGDHRIASALCLFGKDQRKFSIARD